VGGRVDSGRTWYSTSCTRCVVCARCASFLCSPRRSLCECECEWMLAASATTTAATTSANTPATAMTRIFLRSKHRGQRTRGNSAHVQGEDSDAGNKQNQGTKKSMRVPWGRGQRISGRVSHVGERRGRSAIAMTLKSGSGLEVVNVGGPAHNQRASQWRVQIRTVGEPSESIRMSERRTCCTPGTICSANRTES
jgi:hypothetical protein